MSCTSFFFSFDSLRIFRVIRFIIKYYHNKFTILPELLILIQHVTFNNNYLLSKNERILKEIFSSLKYKHSFLFLFISYKISILKIIFTKLHILCLLSDLFKFNSYINFSDHIYKLIYFIFDYTNNTYLKFSIFFFKLNYFSYFLYEKFNILKYKHLKITSLIYYKKKFLLSKKHCNFIFHLSIFYFLYSTLIFNKSILTHCIRNIINFCKNKTTLINMLLICILDEKYNRIIDKFYNKYFILDILNLIYKTKKYKNKNYTNDQLLNTVKNTLKSHKEFYNNFYVL